MGREKNQALSIKVADDVMEKIVALGKHWGGLTPGNKTNVISECVRRAHAQELAAKPPKGKK